MPLASFSEWREFIARQPNPHILQTAEWGKLKSAFGWQEQRLIHGSDGVQILFRSLPLGFSLAYAPKPPADGWLIRPQAPLWAEIDALCRQRRAIFLQIEPDAWEEDLPQLPPASAWAAGIPSPRPIQPPRTILVSLTGSEEEILGRMKQKCRYNLRLAEKKDILVRPWQDLDGFHHLMQITGGRDGFGVHSLDYYRRAYQLFHPVGMAELLLAEYASRPLAALMVFGVGQRAYYLYGASSEEERNRMPTYLLQWRAMQWAKQRGCLEYDLWGVPDADEASLEASFETRRDGLWGVYRFKRGFGGQVRRSLAPLDRVYNPALYRLYRLALRLKPITLP